MRLSVKGKNLDVSDSIRSHAERKFAKLSKLVPELAPVEVELSEERNPSNPANQVAEATIRAKGQTVRGREATKDMKASIDQLVDKLERQMKRYRERRRNHRPAEEHPLAKMPAEPVELE
jgi:putative sigma-54 modulation protein